MSTTLPRYRDLPAVAGQPAKTASGLCGPDDNVGRMNLQTPERVRDSCDYSNPQASTQSDGLTHIPRGTDTPANALCIK